MKYREGYAVARDGEPIFYRVIGPNTSNPGIPVALCDGVGCDGYIWKYIERALSETHQVVHWHYRGHGRTPAPRNRDHVCLADLADDLEAVLDAAGVNHAVIAGHSLGVQVSLETYRRHRERTRGLILMCGAYGNPLRTFRGQGTVEKLLPLAAFATRQAPRFVHALWRSLLPTRLAYAVATRIEINPELVHAEDFMPYLEHMAKVDLSLFLSILAHAGRHSAREILPQIDLPTLIVAGEHDGFTPQALSENMHHLIPGSELLVVEGGSHTAPIERPQLVTDTVIRFLDSVPPN